MENWCVAIADMNMLSKKALRTSCCRVIWFERRSRERKSCATWKEEIWEQVEDGDVHTRGLRVGVENWDSRGMIRDPETREDYQRIWLQLGQGISCDNGRNWESGKMQSTRSYPRKRCCAFRNCTHRTRFEEHSKKWSE